MDYDRQVLARLDLLISEVSVVKRKLDILERTMTPLLELVKTHGVRLTSLEQGSLTPRPEAFGE